MTELKPCPFCGGEAKETVDYVKCGGDELELRASVWCSACGVSKSVRFQALNQSFKTFVDIFEKVENMWNKRAKDGEQE